MTNLRIGFGYDVHRIDPDRPLWLGGIFIRRCNGLKGHSDADVIVHAIIDALLGAANLRDIGYHFPNTSQAYHLIDSKELLKKTLKMLADKGFVPVNIDATVCAEEPKLSDLIPEMCATLAAVLGISPDNVSIKATTSETLGFVGRQEGMCAYAVALIEKQNEGKSEQYHAFSSF